MGACNAKDGRGGSEIEEKKKPDKASTANKKLKNNKAAASVTPRSSKAADAETAIASHMTGGVTGDNSNTNNKYKVEPAKNEVKNETMWDRLHKGKSASESSPRLKESIKESSPTIKPPAKASAGSGAKLNATLPARVGDDRRPLAKKDSLNRTTTPADIKKPRWNANSRAGTSGNDSPGVKNTGGKWTPSRTRTKSGKSNGTELTEEESRIASEIIDTSPGVLFEDVAGLRGVKEALREIIVAPALNPALFSGVRSPPRGVLLFGPPGNGKTLLAKAVATECKATFISISASSITSKFVGESEKNMKALFSLARKKFPVVIFIDEIDSILTARSSNDSEASRRLKTEFLVQMDGVGTGAERVLVLGATNHPYELDDAALRRFPKRVYIPQADKETRLALLQHMLRGESVDVSLQKVAGVTEGYSGSDLSALCKEAAMYPLRELPGDKWKTATKGELRPLVLNDFKNAIKIIRPACNQKGLARCKKWGEEFAVTL